MALGSTQPLTEMSTRSISWGYRRPVRKADNLPTSCAVVTKSGSLNFLEPSGPLQAGNGTALPLPLCVDRPFDHHQVEDTSTLMEKCAMEQEHKGKVPKMQF